MTSWLAWLSCGVGISMWPQDLRSVRLRVLAGSGRLTDSRSGATAEARSGLSGLVRGLILGRRVRAGPISLLCGLAVAAMSWAPVGSLAALEFAMVTTVAVLALSSGLIAALLERHRSQRSRELQVAVGVLCAELDAGGSPASALLAAAAVSPTWSAYLLALDGTDTDTDIEPDPDDPRDPSGSLRRAWTVATTTGTPLSGVLARVKADLAADRQATRAVTTALAGPRSTAALLALLPLLGVALGTAMGARPLATLFTTPAGRVLLCAGCVLDAVGVFWTRLLVRSATRT